MTTRMQNAPVVTHTRLANYMITPTMFLEATYGHSQNRAGGLRPGPVGDRRHLLQQRGGNQGVQMTQFASLPAPTCKGSRSCFPMRPCLIPTTTR